MRRRQRSSGSLHDDAVGVSRPHHRRSGDFRYADIDGVLDRYSECGITDLERHDDTPDERAADEHPAADNAAAHTASDEHQAPDTASDEHQAANDHATADEHATADDTAHQPATAWEIPRRHR